MTQSPAGSPRGDLDPVPGAPVISAYLGRQLRLARVAQGLRQEDVARAARHWGLPWTQATVAALEAGRRHLSTPELILAPWIATGHGPGEATAGQATAPLPEPVSALSISLRLMRLASITYSMRGAMDEDQRAALAREVHLLQLPERPARSQAPSAPGPEARAVLERLWPEQARTPEGGAGLAPLLRAAHLDRLGDAEGKAARRLRTFRLAVAAAARKRWGHSLTEERERRVAGLAADPRSLQARRGHVTRALIAELREEGIEGLRAG